MLEGQKRRLIIISDSNPTRADLEICLVVVQLSEDGLIQVPPKRKKRKIIEICPINGVLPLVCLDL